MPKGFSSLMDFTLDLIVGARFEIGNLVPISTLIILK